MRNVKLEDSIHARIKTLAELTGTTIGRLIHRGAEYIAKVTEQDLAKKEKEGK